MSDRDRKGGGRRRRRRFRDKPAGQPAQPGRRGRPDRGEGGAPAAPSRASGPAAAPRGPREAKGSTSGAVRRASGGGDPARRGQAGGRESGRRPGRDRERRPEYKSVILVPEEGAALCPLCAKPVRDVVAALAYGEDQAPAHFDCVLERLKAGRRLGEGEQICYLGGGSFGVVRFAKGEGDAPFTIGERIPYEGVQERPSWRRDLDSVRGRSPKVPDQS